MTIHHTTYWTFETYWDEKQVMRNHVKPQRIRTHLKLAKVYESLFGGLEWTTRLLEWATGMGYWNTVMDY